MTDPSLGRKKRRITCIASEQGREKAYSALENLGFESKKNLAESKLLALSTVNKFFQRKPIQLDSFKSICEALKLNWKEIKEKKEEELGWLENNDCSNSDTNEGARQVQTVHRQVTVRDPQTKTIKAVILLEGSINSVNNDLLVSLESIFRTYSGDTIKITDVKEGSIRLIVEGSQEDIERLGSRIKSGELKEVRGFPVEDVQILSESSDDDESNELDDKWCLVAEIVAQAVEGRSLSGADLSDANLSGADLSRANLSDADLSGADLSGADLSGADLSGADLSEAVLSSANLRGVDLRSANLSDVDLRGVDLSGVDLLCTNLSNANLSNANLSSVNLRGADLRSANLSNANLSNAEVIVDADLSDANLSGADLSDANLSGADLSRANLSDADLRRANLIGAKVESAQFGRNTGLTEALKIDLEKRGAKFEDSPGDRSLVSSGKPT